ncbi:nucleic-acid-binding protein from transposon X-element [Trichonephila clavata]|uniref:Nucleic-acid-binding protein from transposon X-element n=1 Tax=Trichonephila clavata TaxID=2740835 RepID=A0A8X6H1P8_TRICU|nr:nucleic-acid-binding protein from transposon X-element [Trichonephila clavata]
MQAFTYQLKEDKEFKVVLRGMPADMSPQEIMDDLFNLGISPSYCHVMTNRKTHLPMPLFLISLPSHVCEDNRNIYNITEVCSVKVSVEILDKKPDPAQCYRCQGFFHNSRYCTRNPICLKCGKPHLTKDCKKTDSEDPTCCNFQGNHPANFLGCPNNPLNKPPPVDKKKVQEERLAKRKEMLARLRKRTPPPSEKPYSAPPKPTSVAPKSPTTTAPKSPALLYSQALDASLPKDNPPPSQASSSTEGLNTFKMFQDSDVKEMLQTLRTFLQISKSKKSKAEKFIEIAALLDLDLFV